MVPIRAVVSVTFTLLPTPVSSVQSAVWTDVQKLQGSYAVVPYNPGVTPPELPICNAPTNVNR
jgi:hypothetical protein